MVGRLRKTVDFMINFCTELPEEIWITRREDLTELLSIYQRAKLASASKVRNTTVVIDLSNWDMKKMHYLVKNTDFGRFQVEKARIIFV